MKRVLSVLPHLVIDGRTEQVIHHLDRVEGGVTEVRVTAPVGLVTGGHASLRRTEERGGVSRYHLFGRVSVPTPYWQASCQRRRGSVGVSQLGRLRRMTTAGAWPVPAGGGDSAVLAAGPPSVLRVGMPLAGGGEAP